MTMTHPPVPLSTHQDTFAVDINLEDHVDEDKPPEAVTVCTDSWWAKFTPRQDQIFPCISVKYDVNSMRGYSKSGFGVNYCAENGAQFKDKLEGVCFWGGMAGAIAVSALSGGVTGTVIVPVAIGSASVGCEKIINMDSKWPHSQY